LVLCDVLAVLDENFLDLAADLGTHGHGRNGLDVAHGRQVDGYILADHFGHFNRHRGTAASAFAVPLLAILSSGIPGGIASLNHQ